MRVGGLSLVRVASSLTSADLVAKGFASLAFLSLLALGSALIAVHTYHNRQCALKVTMSLLRPQAPKARRLHHTYFDYG